MKQKIKNALISVSDKENLKSLLIILRKYKINIISSGGTYRSIKKLGFKCEEISEYTGFDEMLDGRNITATSHTRGSGYMFGLQSGIPIQGPTWDEFQRRTLWERSIL